MGKQVNHEKEVLLQKSLQAIKILQKKVEELEKRENEPIAIIGMACRFPGNSDTPDKFWEFLKNGGEVSVEVPRERWNYEDYYNADPDVPGKSYAKEASFLSDDVTLFDAGFFGISPSEASEMDPNQRLLLEVSWEALESACVDMNKISDLAAGVYIGFICGDYWSMHRDPKKITPYSFAGMVGNMISGRISYVLGLNGPSLVVDTACSAAAVAIHLACSALRSGECNIALAGGSNLILMPDVFIGLSKLKVLAKDGKCKPFDANGDGYGRGEGVGVVALKRLSEAIKDGDYIHAVIKGSAVNNDGKGRSLASPNVVQQKKLLEKSLENAGLSPDDVGYFEAHGPGTPVGDPIEMEALRSVYGNSKNRKVPLMVGSVKGNINNGEYVGGVSALIKTVLCIKNKAIPPTMRLKSMNPKLNLEKIPAIVPTEFTIWDTGGKKRVCAMNSFGLSGTSVNIIVEEAPEIEAVYNRKTDKHQNSFHILTLSAKGMDALIEKVKTYCDYLDNNKNASIQDICYTSNTGRSHFANRAAFVADNLERLRNDLNSFVSENSNEFTPNRYYLGTVQPKGQIKPVFIFKSKMNGMLKIAKRLYAMHPKFKEILENCDELIKTYLEFSLIEYINSGNSASDLSEPGRSEACLLVVQYSILNFWKCLGIKPGAVFGEKTGELSAACAAGIMSFETAVKVIAQEICKMPGQISFGGSFNTPRIRYLSNLSGKEIDKAVSMDYWKDIFGKTVSHEISLQYLAEKGYNVFINIGDGLKGANDSNSTYKLIDTVSDENTEETFLKAIARVYCMGATIEWNEFEKGNMGRKIPLPTYPFQRKRYWSEAIMPTRPVDYTNESIFGGNKQVEADITSKIDTVNENEKKAVNPELVGKLNSVSLQEGIDVLHEYIEGILSGLLNIAPSEMDIAESFSDMGVDSIMSLVIKNKIESELGLPIDIGILDQGTSIAHLAEVLLRSFSYKTSPKNIAPALRTGITT
ncbi:MAG: acyltransferase domain-containing protein [Clostridia bacterium]|nr:acyltransferase domain-containing protein [Clostridia bacterium]